MKTLSTILFLFVALAVQATNTVYFTFSDFSGGVNYFAQTNVVLTVKMLTAPTVIGSTTILKDWIRYTNNTSGSVTGLFHAGVYACSITAKNTESTFQITVTNSATAINASTIITVPTNTVSGTGQAYSQAAARALFIEDPSTRTNGQCLAWNGSAWVASNVVASGGGGTTYTANTNQIDLTGNVISLITATRLTNLNAVNLTNAGAFTNTSTADIGGAFTANGGFTVKNGATTNLDIGNVNTIFYPNGLSGLIKVGTNNGKGMTYDKSANNFHVDKLGGSQQFFVSGTSGDGGFGGTLNVTGSVFSAGILLAKTDSPTITNSIRILSGDGNNFRNALFQNGNTLQFTNGTQGLTADFNEDTPGWTFYFNVIAPNLAYLSAFNITSNFLNSAAVALTNNINTRGTESTNFARGTIGLAATNAIQSAGAESTNFARASIGLPLTNLVAALQTTVTANTATINANSNSLAFFTNGYPGPTNTLTLNNNYQLYTASGNVSITNLTGSLSDRSMWSTLWITNSSAVNITNFITVGRPIGTGTTNQLIIASGKVGVVSFQSYGTMFTNYSTAVQQ